MKVKLVVVVLLAVGGTAVANPVGAPPVETAPVTAPSSETAKPSGWRSVALVSAGATLTLGATFLISGRALSSVSYGNDCLSGGTDSRFVCRHGDALSTTAFVAGTGAVIGAVVTTVALIKWRSAHHRSRSTVGRLTSSVAPVVAGNRIGAVLSLEW